MTSDAVTFVGHATTLVRLEGTAVITDPVLRDRIGPLRRQAAPIAGQSIEGVDVALVSHLHRDHLDLPSLRRLSPSVPLIVPRGAGAIVSKAGATEVIELGRGETVSLGAVTVTAVRALHDHRRGPLGATADPQGYLIASERRTVYFPGDTDLFEEMSELPPLDLALLPVWGWGPKLGEGHLDPAGAARALEMLQPRLAVPIHWGTFYPVGLRRLRPRPLSEPPFEFDRRASAVAPEVEVRVLRPGESMVLSRPAQTSAGGRGRDDGRGPK